MSNTGRALTAEDLEEYSGNKVVAISIVFLVLTTVFLGLRFYSKRLMRSKSGWDDILLVGAYLCNASLCTVIIGKSGLILCGCLPETRSCR